MSEPYFALQDGQPIRSEDWNRIQRIIKEEVRTHRHGGGSVGETDPARLGGLIRAAGLRAGAITAEKIAPGAVSSRALAAASIGPAQLAEDPAIDERKVAFDPDEPAARATTRVVLRVDPAALAGLGGLADHPGGLDGPWSIPAGTRVSAAGGSLPRFRTVEAVALSRAEPSVHASLRCETTGLAGNLPAGTLADAGSPLPPAFIAGLSATQPEPALSPGSRVAGEPPRPTRVRLLLRVAPGTPEPWDVPPGLAFAHAGRGFETVEERRVLPWSAWVRATRVPGSGGDTLPADVPVPGGTLVAGAGLPAEVAAGLEVHQPDPATPTGVWVRLRLRTAPTAPVDLPAGTILHDAADQLRFETEAALTLDAGGAELISVEAPPPEEGEEAPTAGSVFALVHLGPLESVLEVLQPEPATGGADGGSLGHHHVDAPDALPSRPLAAGSVGSTQLAPGAVTRAKLSPPLLARFEAVRTQLVAIEAALTAAGVLETLSEQRHRRPAG